jgi:hypothetical protein
MEEAVTLWTAAHPDQPLRAMLLGVTPEIARMGWPEKSSLIAVDSSLPMAQAVWPGNLAQRRWVACGNWLALPQRESSCQVAIADGSLNCLSYPNGFRALAKAVSGVLCGDGILVMRCYIQSGERETPEAVYADARRGTIRSFHAFKLRLLMAMQHTTEEGIAVKDVYRYLVNHNFDLQSLPLTTGWRKSAIETIEFYRDATNVYAFPTPTELRFALTEFFEEVAISTPRYEMGERCPTLVLRPCRNTPQVRRV